MSEPFIALMRRYCIDYTARHDLSVCDEIMEPTYTLHMGGHHVAGRDDAYKAAARRQFTQFPGLGLTVNEIVFNGERLAMRFSEHGASVRHENAHAAWSGIGLYRWNGTRLTENYVEQDYYARRRQLADGCPDTVEPPAVAPWDTAATPPVPAREALVRDWLSHGDPAADQQVEVDDARSGRPARPLITINEVVIDDLFSAGGTVAFHAVQVGRVAGGDHGFASWEGAPAILHMSGVVATSPSAVIGGRVIRDRIGLSKRLAG